MTVRSAVGVTVSMMGDGEDRDFGEGESGQGRG
jgi:hypothetical protein